MSRPSGLDRVWLPPLSDENILTSAELIEGPNADSVVLYVLGDAVANFTVPPGLGARVLTELRLERQG